MHPSVTTFNDFYLKLNRVRSHYNNELPCEPTLEKMQKLENLVTVNC